MSRYTTPHLRTMFTHFVKLLKGAKELRAVLSMAHVFDVWGSYTPLYLDSKSPTSSSDVGDVIHPLRIACDRPDQAVRKVHDICCLNTSQIE